MTILLDTHVLLWAASGELSSQFAGYIDNSENVLLFSSASIWEIVIKLGLGRKDFIVDPASLYSGLLSAGYQELKISAKHALLVGSMPQLHKDPFDRILLAQAMCEGVPLLTSDDTLTKYPVSTIFCFSIMRITNKLADLEGVFMANPPLKQLYNRIKH